MTAENDVAVAIMSGNLVIELLLKSLTFNRAALMLGGTHLLSRVLGGLWIRLSTSDEYAPKH